MTTSEKNEMPGGKARRYEALINKGVACQDNSACLLWPYYCDEDGYARIGIRRVARIVCTRVRGPAPTDAHEAAHSCNNPPCFNGMHLNWKTHQENMRDTVRCL